MAILDKEVQTLIVGNSITREIDVNVNTRKVIHDIYQGDSKLLQPGGCTNSGATNADDAGYTFAIRACKKTQ